MIEAKKVLGKEKLAWSKNVWMCGCLVPGYVASINGDHLCGAKPGVGGVVCGREGGECGWQPPGLFFRGLSGAALLFGRGLA